MKRKITAIMAADVARYSNLVAEDEEETLRRLSAYRSVFDDFVLRYGGRIFNTAGDSVMCEFESAVEAVRAAIDIQESLRTRNLAYLSSRWLQFRIGIAVGDVVERDGDLLGDAVNIVSRLEQLAEPGGICVSRTVHEAVSSKLSIPFMDLGQREMKNIPAPVHAFAIVWPGTGSPAPMRGDASPPRRRSPLLWAAASCLAILALGAGAVTVQRLAAPGGHPHGSVAAAPPASPARPAGQASAPAGPPAPAHRKGGPAEDVKSAPMLYQTALLLEARGEPVGAHRAYYNLARMGFEFIDPHLRYAALVRTQEGQATAREVYAELNEDAPTRATALVHALQFEGAERLARLEALIGAHPDYAPAYHFLAEEHSDDRIGGTQTLRDKQIAFAALAEFLKADREARLSGYFLDQSVPAGWIDRARKRHAALEAFLKGSSATPAISFMRTNSGWVASVSTPEIATSIAYRIGAQGDFRATGHMPALDPRTGKPVPQPGFALPPDQKATTIFIRYADATGREIGPFPVPFHPLQALQKAQRDILERMPGSWIAFREAQVSYTNLASYRCAIAKATLGLDEGPLNRELALPACDEQEPYGIDGRVKPSLSLPRNVKSVSVQLTYADGTQSEVRTFRRQ